MTRTIWIISEGSPGHVSQSAGLATALADRTPLEIHQFECRPKINGFVRHLIRLIWMGKNGKPLPDRWLYGSIGLERSAVSTPPPDLILSSGGRSVFAARTLAVRHGVPFVFLGERKPYPASWFHTTFTPSSLETATNDIRMDVIPTKITEKSVREAAADWLEKPSGKLWTILIGGKSRSHDYQDNDWENLVAGMVALAERESIRWLLTTSRRTGKEVEARLQALLPREILADAVWWCHQPEKKFNAYLGAADRIWVTQDSVSMVTEAVSARKPVSAISPAHTPFPETSFVPGYMARLESLGLVERFPISQMAATRTTTSADFPNNFLTVPALAEILMQRLDWLQPQSAASTPLALNR